MRIVSISALLINHNKALHLLYDQQEAILQEITNTKGMLKYFHPKATPVPAPAHLPWPPARMETHLMTPEIFFL